jgi:hypothetical protein
MDISRRLFKGEASSNQTGCQKCRNRRHRLFTTIRPLRLLVGIIVSRLILVPTSSSLRLVKVVEGASGSASLVRSVTHVKFAFVFSIATALDFIPIQGDSQEESWGVLRLNRQEWIPSWMRLPVLSRRQNAKIPCIA